ncbi:unnamed protein product [Rotaria socialis]
MVTNSLRGNRWIWFVLVILFLVALAICGMIVLSLIPIFLPDSSSDPVEQYESITVIYDLPNRLDNELINIRHDQLNDVQNMVFEQLLNTILANDRHTQNVQLSTVKGITNGTDQQQKTENITLEKYAVVVKKNAIHALPQSVLATKSLVRLVRGISGQPKDTTSQLYLSGVLIFLNGCSRSCRLKILGYMQNELLLNIDVERETYMQIFRVANTTTFTTSGEATTKIMMNTTTTATSTTLVTTSPNKSSYFLSEADITLLNVDENQFNELNKTIVLQLSSPILDTNNYTVFANENNIVNNTNTTSSITIFEQFAADYVLISLFAIDINGFPIFASFDLYFGSISMPVRVVFSNGTAAAGVTVTANLTDSPRVSQAGVTDGNGSITFKNVPLRTISLLARTKDNLIGFTGVAASTKITTIVLSSTDNADTLTKSVIFDKYQREIMINASVYNSKQGYSSKFSVPGFTITTAGEGLTSTFRQFMTDANSTKIYVRYKFVTSEVPGGYFGSRYNDYYSVSIRSESGQFESISQSMNALGLGAFDYASGATDWFVLALSLSGKPELIRIDVGVANVGDSAFQSSVVVDQISADKCEKCDDCVQCKSDPMCENTCNNPPIKSCNFYTNCMEKKVSCGPDGYAIGYGSKFCNKFAHNLATFTSSGVTWVYTTMNCLQKALVSPLKNCEDNCQVLRQIAFDSHPSCYNLAPGVCSLRFSDWAAIFSIVGNDLFTLEGLTQATKTIPGCSSRLATDISSAIGNAAYPIHLDSINSKFNFKQHNIEFIRQKIKSKRKQL